MDTTAVIARPERLARPAAAATWQVYVRLAKLDIYDYYLATPLLLAMLLPGAGTLGAAGYAVLGLFLLGGVAMFAGLCAFDDVTGHRDGSDAANYGPDAPARRLARKPLLAGALGERQAIRFAWSAVAVQLLCWGSAVLLAPARPWWALALTAACAFAGFQYSWWLRLSYRGWQEFLLAGYGWVFVLAPYGLVTGRASGFALVLALLFGLGPLLFGVYSNVNDIAGDRAGGRPPHGRRAGLRARQRGLRRRALAAGGVPAGAALGAGGRALVVRRPDRARDRPAGRAVHPRAGGRRDPAGPSARHPHPPGLLRPAGGRLPAERRCAVRLLPGPRPLDLGPLLETLAERGSPTVVRLSRPLDLEPERGTSWTIPQLAELVREMSGVLTAAGIRPGHRVAVHKRNHWDYALLAAAAARIGAVPALLSDHLTPEALAVLLARLDPALLVSDRYTLALGGVPPRVRTLCLDGPAPGAIDGATLRGGAVPPIHRRPDDEPLVINHTSGTTGLPKLVIHSTTTLIRKLTSFEAHRWPVLSVRPEDTVASAIAFSHGRAVSWTISALWARPRTLTILADPEPAGAARLLRAHRPTVLEALPATYVRWQHLAAEPDSPFRDMRLYINTFDAMHPPTVRAFLAASRRRAPIWMQGWGQTETGPLTFRFLTRRSVAARELRHPTTRDLGRPVPGRIGLRVVDPATGRPVRRGEPGVVLARTPGLCVGYAGEQQRWADKSAGRWFNTGDIGVRTRSGRLRLLDREVDMIPGLSCVELEDVLHDRLPEVEEAVVLDAGRERPPLPVLVTRGGGLDPEQWRRAVRDLPVLAEPLLLGWDAVPRTGTGKVRRQELRQRYLAGAAAFGTGRWT
ncbi:hypothetical protein GCM10009665_43840 [Kitasatospora nipponensis]|uniref:AMP-dependent synthetase/ligase domain-containing protein n=1 Tax=Kitasatospora nipponensis TaxID=258049 RepID=A0ABN1WHC9_9ACTN